MTVRDRPVFVLRLRPEPGIDATRALKAALKVLGRRFGLRAVEIRQEGEPPLTGKTNGG